MINPKFRSFWIAFFLSLWIQGCGTTSFYLHSDRDEVITKELKESFQKANIDALFDKASTDLEDHLKAERKTVNELINSAQDVQLVSLIIEPDQKPKNVSKYTASTRLIDSAKNRLIRIIGEDPTQKILEIKNLNIKRALGKLNEIYIKQDRTVLNKAIKLYKKFGGKSTNSCVDPEKNSMPQTPPKEDTGDIKNLYNDLYEACQDLKTKILKNKEEVVLLGIPFKNISQAGKKNELVTIYNELQTLKKTKQDLKSANEALKKELDKLKEEYKKAFKDLKQNPNTVKFKTKLNNAAKKITDFLKKLDKGNETIAKVVELTKENDLVNLSSFQEITGVPIDFLGDLFKAEVLNTNLNSVLTAVLDQNKKADENSANIQTSTTGKEEEKTEEEKRAEAYYSITIRAVDAFSNLSDALSDPPKMPSPNSMLITLTYQRHKIETARVDAAVIDNQLLAKKTQYKALLEEIYYLWDTHRLAQMADNFSCHESAMGFAQYFDNCNKDDAAKAAVTKALIAFDNSWSQGLNNFTAASLSESQLIQQLSLEKTRGNAKAWFEIMKPAVEQLDEFGKGGIKQETFARLAQAILLFSIALEVD